MHNASAAYRRAKELDPSNLGASVNHCNIIQFFGDVDGAIGCYQALLSEHPTYDRAITNLAGALYVKGE
jgi:tetratricopeptide (TPR) repeat protein